MFEEDHIPELARLRQISERLVSPELAAKIIENLPDALVVTDIAGRIVLFNAKAEKLF
jgi:PAS domain-containing protein